MFHDDARTPTSEVVTESHPAPSPAPSSPATPGLATNKLGVMAITFFVMAAAAPIAAIVGGSPVIFSAVGPAAPVMFVIMALLMAMFAVGYLRMSRYITNAGGFVAYIAAGLGNKWASAGAGLVILTYLSLQIGLWSQFGVFAEALVSSFTGLALPPMLWILLAMVAITALAARGVDASVKFLGVLIVGEILVIAALVIALVAQNGFSIFSFEGFTAENILGPGLGVGLLFAMLCFTSFEATVVFSEEARDPRHTIPRALYLVIAFVGVFYGLATWAIGGSVGPGAIQQAATEDPSGLIMGLAETSAGHWLNVMMQIVVVTSFIAMLLGINNMFARYLFSLGRAGFLPRRLARVSRRQTPAQASFANSGTVLAALALLLMLGADPIVVVYAWFTALGTAGFMGILILTSIAIIAFFLRRQSAENAWATLVAPAGSVIVFTYIAWVTIDNYTLLSGSTGAAKWLLLTVPLALVLGYLRARSKKTIDYAANIF